MLSIVHLRLSANFCIDTNVEWVSVHISGVDFTSSMHHFGVLQMCVFSLEQKARRQKQFALTVCGSIRMINHLIMRVCSTKVRIDLNNLIELDEDFQKVSITRDVTNGYV